MAINSFARAGLSRVSSPGNAVISGTPTGTYTDSGFNYAYFTFTSSSTLTVTTAGFADVLIVGGGGGGGQNRGGGGGAGGHLYATSIYFPVGTAQVRVGAGGASSTTGNPSGVYDYIVAPGGGSGGRNGAAGGGGGSGGGGSSTVSRQVPRGALASACQGRIGPRLRPCRSRSVSSSAQATVLHELEHLRQAPVWWSRAGHQVPWTLHPSGGYFQPSSRINGQCRKRDLPDQVRTEGDAHG